MKDEEKYRDACSIEKDHGPRTIFTGRAHEQSAAGSRDAPEKCADMTAEGERLSRQGLEGYPDRKQREPSNAKCPRGVSFVSPRFPRQAVEDCNESLPPVPRGVRPLLVALLKVAENRFVVGM